MLVNVCARVSCSRLHSTLLFFVVVHFDKYFLRKYFESISRAISSQLDSGYTLDSPFSHFPLALSLCLSFYFSPTIEAMQFRAVRLPANYSQHSFEVCLHFIKTAPQLQPRPPSTIRPALNCAPFAALSTAYKILPYALYRQRSDCCCCCERSHLVG